MKKVDLVGQQFGELTVMAPAQNIGKRTAWHCKCSCGNEIIKTGEDLKRIKIPSCGQCQNNLIGQKFGRLTVIEKTNKRTPNKYIIYLCKCDCGNIKEASSHDLRWGDVKSCGCLLSEDLTGNKYGKVTVLERLNERDKKGGVLWKCQCECGNVFKVPSGRVKTLSSCGCITSLGEQKITQILIANNIEFETQKSFETCRFPSTNWLARFDFYLPTYNLLIEYDGIQHFESSASGWSTSENLATIKERDRFKNEWCKQNNIKLNRIPYTKYDSLSLEDILCGIEIIEELCDKNI